jgi:hypothetical protein
MIPLLSGSLLPFAQAGRQSDRPLPTIQHILNFFKIQRHRIISHGKVRPKSCICMHMDANSVNM